MQAIEQRMRQVRIPLDEWEIRQFRYRMPGETEDIDAEWRPFRVGDRWGGGPDISAYFRKTITIPAGAGRQTDHRCASSLGGDSLVYVNGVPHHGLDIFRNELLLTPARRPAKLIELFVESFVYWHGHGGEPSTHALEMAEMVYVDPDIHAAYWDFRAAVKMFAVNDMEPGLRAFLEKTVWEPLKEVPVDEPDLAEFKRLLQGRPAAPASMIFTSRTASAATA